MLSFRANSSQQQTDVHVSWAQERGSLIQSVHTLTDRVIHSKYSDVGVESLFVTIILLLFVFHSLPFFPLRFSGLVIGFS